MGMVETAMPESESVVPIPPAILLGRNPDGTFKHGNPGKKRGTRWKISKKAMEEYRKTIAEMELSGMVADPMQILLRVMLTTNDDELRARIALGLAALEHPRGVEVSSPSMSRDEIHKMQNATKGALKEVAALL